MLSQIVLPIYNNQTSDGFFSALKRAFNPKHKKTISDLIEEYREQIGQEILRFRANILKLNQLSEVQRKDPLFYDIDHLFCTKLNVLHNELVFCQFDNLGNADYFCKTNSTFTSLFKDFHTLNDSFSEYMYALSRTAFDDNRQDLEIIKTKVRSMSEAVDAFKADI